MTDTTLLDWSGSEDLGTARAVEAAYVAAAEREHGSEFAFWARVDDAGRVTVAQVLKIVETVENECREVKLENVAMLAPEAALGQYVINIIDPVEPEAAALKAARLRSSIRNVRIAT